MKAWLIALLGAALLGTGCVTSRPGETTTSSAGGFPSEVVWSLVELEGKPVATVNNGRHPTLRLDPAQTRATGHGGVNSFGGAYTLQGHALRLGPLMATKMAGPPEMMRLEVAYLGALARVATWKVENGLLELRSTEGEVLARFEKQPQHA